MSQHGPNREIAVAPPQWPKELLLTPNLEIEDIFAVQALVMGYLRMRARTKLVDHDERKYRLSLLDSESDDIYADTVFDGSRDTYLSCKVQKMTFDQWQMRISFLEMCNTNETRLANHRQMYSFDWLRNGSRQAWYTDTSRYATGAGVVLQVHASHPITSDSCLELQDRMLAVSQAANPISSRSILTPCIERK